MTELSELPGIGEPDDIPPFPRMPDIDTPEMVECVIASIDNRIRRLGSLGLRPHPNMLEYRSRLVSQLENGGPYVIEMSSYML